MATFEARVKGYTGLTLTGDTVPTQTELTQFLKDGVIDVTRKSIDINKGTIVDFLVDSGEKDANDSFDLNGARIATVLREAGVNNDWREAQFIPPSLVSRVTDKESMHYASKYNPVFTILEDGKINVYPAPGANPNTFKVYFVNDAPQNKSGIALTYAHDDIKYFSDSKVDAVVLYAAIKVLQAKMSELTFIEEDPELVNACTVAYSMAMNNYTAIFGQVPDTQQSQAEGQISQGAG